MNEVVCEGVQIKGARFSIPETLFAPLIHRIQTQAPTTYLISDFLTNRASKKFRNLFFNGRATLSHPVIASSLRPNVSSCRLMATLKADGLLDQEAGAAFEDILFEKAEAVDCVELPISAKEFLGEARYAELIKVALDNVTSNRADIVTNWAECWDSDIDPESYFDTLAEKIGELALSIDAEMPQVLYDSLSNDIDDHLYGMREEYAEKQSREEADIEISAPSKSLNDNAGAAEIDALFSDVAD
jgi:hypothetical protein